MLHTAAAADVGAGHIVVGIIDIDGCSDFVITEMAKLDIARYARGGEATKE